MPGITQVCHSYNSPVRICSMPRMQERKWGRSGLSKVTRAVSCGVGLEPRPVQYHLPSRGMWGLSGTMLQGGVMTLQCGEHPKAKTTVCTVLMVETAVRGLAQTQWAHHAQGYQADAAVNTPETWSQRHCFCPLGRPGPLKIVVLSGPAL